MYWILKENEPYFQQFYWRNHYRMVVEQKSRYKKKKTTEGEFFSEFHFKLHFV